MFYGEKFDAGRHGQTLTEAKLAEGVSAHLQAKILFLLSYLILSCFAPSDIPS
jgi:hypothetical protein